MELRVRNWPAAMCAGLLVGGPASAQERTQDSTTLNRFSASALPADDFQLDRPLAPGHLAFGAMVHLDQTVQPHVYVRSGESGQLQEAEVVRQQSSANIALSFGLTSRLVLFGGLPVTAWIDGDRDARLDGGLLDGPDEAGVGDAYGGVRVVLAGKPDDWGAIALQSTVNFPTAGKDQRFRGDNEFAFAPELLVALRPGAGARITANLGGRFRTDVNEDTSSLDFGEELVFGLGFALPVAGDERDWHLDVHAQAFGSTTFDNIEGSPAEALGGLKFFSGGGFIAGLAGGAGFTRGFGSPVARALLMLGYQTPSYRDRDGDGILDKADLCPEQPEDADGYEDEDGCRDPDNDQDGIEDSLDRCPLEGESQNGLEDEDGCPDAWGDSDEDSVLDNVDECKDEPEDPDSFEDEDGCPDPDNDQDGVPDERDACPVQRGVAEVRGCPLPDRDSDGVPDRIDNCPDEAGLEKYQGCNSLQRVQIADRNIKILESVYFGSARAVIQARSFPLLDNVASVLHSHPELRKIIVEGHSDSRGRRSFNRRLSQKRADAVVEYLVQRGVAAGRLEARGYGPDKPRVEPARSASDHSRNRRVEFVIPPAGREAQPE